MNPKGTLIHHNPPIGLSHDGTRISTRQTTNRDLAEARDKHRERNASLLSNPASPLLDTVADIGKETNKTVASTMGLALEKSKNFIKKTMDANENNGFKGFASIGLLVILGISLAKGLLGIFTNLFSKTPERVKKLPTALKSIFLLLNSAVLTGLYKSMKNRADGFQSSKPLVHGIALLIASVGITSLFENPNGLPSKLFGAVGLREPMINLLNQFSFNSARMDTSTINKQI